MQRTHTVAGEWSGEGGAAERKHCGLTATLCTAGWGGRVGNIEVKSDPGKKRGREVFCLCFSPSNSILIGDKLN